MIEREIFCYFIGSWRIKRVLGNIGIAEGRAIFEPDLKHKYQLNYSELLGTNYTDFPSIQYAVRNYIYLYHKQDGTISKNYEDGSILYNLDFSSYRNYASGAYLCGKDTYNAHYSFIDSQNFTLEYVVKGPHKDFTIYSHFIRKI